jgi:hypothetical protein
MTIKDLYIDYLTDPNEILRVLQISINIPILPKFHKYIIGDIKGFNAKSIILKKEIKNEIFKEEIDKIIGNVLIYHDDEDILFFGFFGVYDHDPNKIEYLLDELIKYAKKKKFKYIRGPINIPTVIFGWGFMVEGSFKDLFITLPVNPPVYQKVFLRKGFYIKFRELHFQGPAWKLNPYNLKNYDFSDYEYVNPGKEGIYEVKDEFIRLHMENLPRDSQITPNAPRNFDNIVNFIFENGEPWMVWVVYYKPTRKIIACGYAIPNPFSLDKKGRIDTVSFHSWVIQPKHRGRGLTLFMYGECSQRGMPPKGSIRKGGGPVGSSNISNIGAAKNLGFCINREHIILEYKF